jgi:hypothetical protein
MLSVSILRKNTTSDIKRRQPNSYTEITLRFTPSFSFCKGLIARLYANTAGGVNVMQSLSTVQIVPRYEGIFYDTCCGNVSNMMRRFHNKEALPNSTDKYGHSLISMVIISNSEYEKSANVISYLSGSCKWPF